MTDIEVIGGGDDGGSSDIAYVQGLGHDKIRAVLTLWTSGANYGEIAAQLGLRSPAVVQIAVERALGEMADDNTDRPKQRRKMSLVLDRLMKGVMVKAVNPDSPEHLQAVRTAISLVERYSRLNNLDAPQEVTVHMPGQEEFTTFIAAAARGMGMALPEEADPFADEYNVIDAEVLDDGEPEG